jgi:hypothetical protein
MLVLPFAAARRAPRSVAILGNAAGTTARAYGHYFPRARVDAVEIDAELTKVGRELFDLRGRRLRVYTADARPFLRRTQRRWDVIVVDAYRQPYIPFYLTTREFFALVRERLAPGGVVLVNVGHPEGSDRLEQVLARRWAPSCRRSCATRQGHERRAARDGGRRFRGPAARRRRRRCRPTCGRSRTPPRPPGAALRGGSVYTDDRAPVEWLVDASILQVAAHGER